MNINSCAFHLAHYLWPQTLLHQGVQYVEQCWYVCCDETVPPVSGQLDEDSFAVIVGLVLMYTQANIK